MCPIYLGAYILDMELNSQWLCWYKCPSKMPIMIFLNQVLKTLALLNSSKSAFHIFFSSAIKKMHGFSLNSKGIDPSLPDIILVATEHTLRWDSGSGNASCWIAKPCFYHYERNASGLFDGKQMKIEVHVIWIFSYAAHTGKWQQHISH